MNLVIFVLLAERAFLGNRYLYIKKKESKSNTAQPRNVCISVEMMDFLGLKGKPKYILKII